MCTFVILYLTTQAAPARDIEAHNCSVTWFTDKAKMALVPNDFNLKQLLEQICREKCISSGHPFVVTDSNGVIIPSNFPMRDIDEIHITLGSDQSDYEAEVLQSLAPGNYISMEPIECALCQLSSTANLHISSVHDTWALQINEQTYPQKEVIETVLRIPFVIFPIFGQTQRHW